MGRERRMLGLRCLLLGAALAGGCHDDPPVETGTGESATIEDDTPIGTEAGNRLAPAPDRFADGCANDSECTIEEDPCGYAQAVLEAKRSDFQAGFEGRAYDCPPVEYAAPPVAACESGRCVGRVPGG